MHFNILPLKDITILSIGELRGGDMGNKELVRILKELSEANGAPGCEDNVRELIAKFVENYVEKLSVDRLGNLITVKGEGRPKVMLAAHMDEVSLMIRHIDDNGFIKFVNLGSVSPHVLLGEEVAIEGSKGVVYGVVGTKPPHLREPTRELRIEDLYIDVGAESKKDVAELGISVGDFAFFNTKFRVHGKRVMGKAFDDRVGCTVLIEVLREVESIKGSLYGVFTVQEEVGTRGAKVAAFSVEPDVAIVLEGTIAADTPDVPAYKAITRLRRGPAIRVMDATMITNRRLLKFVIEVAEELKVPYQLQISPTSGTDAGRIHLTKSGVPSIVISVPCRYIHSPRSIAIVDDIEHTVELVKGVVKRIHEYAVTEEL